MDRWTNEEKRLLKKNYAWYIKIFIEIASQKNLNSKMQFAAKVTFFFVSCVKMADDV